MSWKVVDLELDDSTPLSAAAEPGFGLGVVLRDRGRIVGFFIVDPERIVATETLTAADLIDAEAREAAAVERLREAGARAGLASRDLSLTVAICSKDRWDWVERLLNSLDAVRDAVPFETLVVDNASVDPRMREICAERDWVRYVHEPLIGLDFARNRALAEASGEVVAYLDDDVVVDRNWLFGLRRAWRENPDAGCVTGFVLPMALDTEAQRLFERRGGFRRGALPLRYGRALAGDPLHPCGAGKFGAGANMSVRRALALGIGGFDVALDTGRPLPGGGDLDMFYRVLRSGATLIYEPQMAVFHEHRRDMAVLRRQYYTWGLGFTAFVSKALRADPPMRRRFLRLLTWWANWQMRRLAKSLLGRDPTPPGMVAVEIWGGVVGLCGEYDRSRRRSAAIAAAAT